MLKYKIYLLEIPTSLGRNIYKITMYRWKSHRILYFNDVSSVVCTISVILHYINSWQLEWERVSQRNTSRASTVSGNVVHRHENIDLWDVNYAMDQ